MEISYFAGADLFLITHSPKLFSVVIIRDGLSIFKGNLIVYFLIVNSGTGLHYHWLVHPLSTLPESDKPVPK